MTGLRSGGRLAMGCGESLRPDLSLARRPISHGARMVDPTMPAQCRATPGAERPPNLLNGNGNASLCDSVGPVDRLPHTQRIGIEGGV